MLFVYETEDVLYNAVKLGVYGDLYIDCRRGALS